MKREPQDLKDALARPPSVLQTFKAVAWSFFGVRRSADHVNDVQKLNPLHLVVAAVIGAAIFIFVLVMLANWVIGSGIAT